MLGMRREVRGGRSRGSERHVATTRPIGWQIGEPGLAVGFGRGAGQLVQAGQGQAVLVIGR